MKNTNRISRLIKVLESTRWFVLASILFRITLDASYCLFVNPVFAYAGFTIDIDSIKYLESWLIYLVLIVYFPKRLHKTSDYIMAYLLFAYLAPLLAFYGLSNASREYLYIIIFTTMVVLFFRAGAAIKLPIVKGGKKITYITLSLSILIVTGMMFKNGGMNFFNLDLSRVYEFRDDAGKAVNQGILSYLNVWATKVFGPVLLAVALWRRNYLIASALIGLHILWFGISSHKSILFYPFLVSFLWVWFQNTKALSLIPLGMAVGVSVSTVIFLLFDYDFAGSLFIRRVFFVPSFLTFSYYEFFSANSFVYWSNSILSKFINYPYDMNTALLIGIYNGTESHANNSFLSTGYMHAGFFGVTFYGVLAGVLFRVIDSVSNKGVPTWVAVSSIIVPIQSLLISADFFTALLTHGIGIALVVLFLIRSVKPASI